VLSRREVTDPALSAAWDALHAALPNGWAVGRPSFHDERREWVLYAYDHREAPRLGKRSREWTAIAATEAGVVTEMARCLLEISEGRWPR